jgi:hypothetical protein
MKTLIEAEVSHILSLGITFRGEVSFSLRVLHPSGQLFYLSIIWIPSFSLLVLKQFEKLAGPANW